MNPRISVIIPVYNVEKYLDRCVESVVSQTEKALEIILVDDGSKDASSVMCDRWAVRDDRITVIHQENRGLTGAWKQGVLASRGEYIGFVDSDDYIAGDMYARMYKKAADTGSDIVCCGIRHVFEAQDHEPWDDEMGFPGELYTKEELRREIYPALLNDGSFMGRKLQPNRVSKLVRRELILECMELCDDRVTVGEDFQFSFSIFPKAGKIAVMKGYLPYYYWVNKQSMTGDYDTAYMDKIKLMKQQLERIGRFYNEYDFSGQIKNDFLCLTVLHIKGGIMKYCMDGYRANRRRIKEVCLDTEVRKALKDYSMPGLTAPEKLFLTFMKHRMYLAIYLAVRVYFRQPG